MTAIHFHPPLSLGDCLRSRRVAHPAPAEKRYEPVCACGRGGKATMISAAMVAASQLGEVRGKDGLIQLLDLQTASLQPSRQPVRRKDVANDGPRAVALLDQPRGERPNIIARGTRLQPRTILLPMNE